MSQEPPTAEGESIPDSVEEGYEQAREQVDEKDLLMRQTFALEQCLVELQQIRQALTSSKSQEESQIFECESCYTLIPESELEQHAKSCFNWSDALGNLESHYNEP